MIKVKVTNSRSEPMGCLLADTFRQFHPFRLYCRAYCVIIYHDRHVFQRKIFLQSALPHGGSILHPAGDTPLFPEKEKGKLYKRMQRLQQEVPL